MLFDDLHVFGELEEGFEHFGLRGRIVQCGHFRVHLRDLPGEGITGFAKEGDGLGSIHKRIPRDLKGGSSSRDLFCLGRAVWLSARYGHVAIAEPVFCARKTVGGGHVWSGVECD